MKTIVWAEEVNKESIPLVGGKGANLGEMTAAGLPIPPSFMVTADAFTQFIEGTGIKDEIFKILKRTDVEDKQKLMHDSERIQKIFDEQKIPEQMEKEILEAYQKLGQRSNVADELVAVRSSATAEDLPDASFAGQQSTYLNVKAVSYTHPTLPTN